MALSKSGEVLGFQTDIYSKITGTDIRETGSNEAGKLYSVSIIVNDYTDNTKSYLFRQRQFNFQNITADSFSIQGMYNILKTDTEFSDAIDV